MNWYTSPKRLGAPAHGLVTRQRICKLDPQGRYFGLTGKRHHRPPPSCRASLNSGGTSATPRPSHRVLPWPRRHFRRLCDSRCRLATPAAPRFCASYLQEARLQPRGRGVRWLTPQRHCRGEWEPPSLPLLLMQSCLASAPITGFSSRGRNTVRVPCGSCWTTIPGVRILCWTSLNLRLQAYRPFCMSGKVSTVQARCLGIGSNWTPKHGRLSMAVPSQPPGR